MKAKFKLASHKQYKANSKSLKPATSTNPAFSIAEYKSEKYEEPSLTPTSTTGDYDADLDQPLYNMAWDSLDEMMIWLQDLQEWEVHTIMDPCQNPPKDYHLIYQIPTYFFLAPHFLLYPLEQPHHHLPFIPIFQQAHSPLYLILLQFTLLHPFLLSYSISTPSTIHIIIIVSSSFLSTLLAFNESALIVFGC